MLFELSPSNEIAQEFGQRLRAQRLAQGLQQAELAGRAGVSERAVRNLERSGQATLDVFLRVTIALGLAGSLEPLFNLKPKSIKAMEEASITRRRAPKRSRREA